MNWAGERAELSDLTRPYRMIIRAANRERNYRDDNYNSSGNRVILYALINSFYKLHLA